MRLDDKRSSGYPNGFGGRVVYPVVFKGFQLVIVYRLSQSTVVVHLFLAAPLFINEQKGRIWKPKLSVSQAKRLLFTSGLKYYIECRGVTRTESVTLTTIGGPKVYKIIEL